MPTEVDVWTARAGSPPPGPDPRSADERRREQRLHRSEDRTLTATGWHLTRVVLGAALDRDPAALDFTRACRACGDPDHGKPRLVGGGPDFSLAHADGTVLVAVTSYGEVGVDVEGAGQDLRDVARDVLTTAERGAGLDPLLAWVRKEALLKADGRGLVVPMTSVELDALQAGPLAGLEVSDLDLGPAYVAALAWRGEGPAVVRHRSAQPS